METIIEKANKKKRISIFVIYDQDGIVDEYIFFLLSELVKISERIIIVVNGLILEEYKARLAVYSDEIIVRENKGFDGAAYKQILTSYLKESELNVYDELILLNDTFFGPFYPFQTIFDRMDQRECDVWGLSNHYESIQWCGTSPEHLQSYFLVFKNQVVRHPAFRKFWNQLKCAESFADAVMGFEVGFSEMAKAAGFKLAAYCELEEYRSDNIGLNYNYSLFSCGDMITRHQFPILKKKSLLHCKDYNYNAKLAMDYIGNHTNYDVSLIWDYLLRKFKLCDLEDNLSLQYVIDGRFAGRSKPTLNIAVILVIHSIADYNECVEYLQNIPQEVDLYFYKTGTAYRQKVDTDNINNQIKCYEIEDLEDGQVVFCLDDQIYDQYDYLCVMQDVARQIVDCGNFLYKQIERKEKWDNCIDDGGYIYSVVKLFEDNKNLGVLFSNEIPRGSEFRFCNFETVWRETFSNTFYIEEEDRIFQGGTSFWCRSSLLKEYSTICKKTEQPDMGKIRVLFPYFVQSRGYFPAHIMNESHADRYIANNNIHLLESDAVKQSNQFLKRLISEKIYLYGCGKVATHYYKELSKNGLEVEAFVVSDNQEKTAVYMDRPVIRLSEYQDNPSNKLIIGVGTKLREEIIQALSAKGITRYI